MLKRSPTKKDSTKSGSNETRIHLEKCAQKPIVEIVLA
jgi:hypothetical protein